MSTVDILKKDKSTLSLSNASSLAFDDEGKLYIIDNNSILYQTSLSNSGSDLIVLDEIQLIDQAYAIALKPKTNTMFFPQVSYGVIAQFHWSLAYSIFSGNNNSIRYSHQNPSKTIREFYAPTVIAFDNEGTMYIVESTITNKFVIKTVDNSGKINSLSGNFNKNIAAMRVDSEKNIYLVQDLNPAVLKVTPEGVISTVAGNENPSSKNKNINGKGSEATFNIPCDISIDNQGNIYILDGGNNNIRKITPPDKERDYYNVSTFAGSENGTDSPGKTDGIGFNARFNAYYGGLTIDPSGANLYVSDAKNHVIRKVSLQ